MAVPMNGRSWSQSDFSNYGYLTPKSPDPAGTPAFPDGVFGDMLAELQFVKAPGGYDGTTNTTVGTGSKTLTFASALTLPAGIYLICRPAEIGNPVNFMIGILASAVIAGTSATVTVPAGGTGGAGSYTGWLIIPLPAKRRPTRSVTAATTVAATDHSGVVRVTSGTFTQALPAAATMGLGFEVTISNPGSGVVTLDGNSTETIDGLLTLILAAGSSATLYCTGTGWETISKTAGGMTPGAVYAALGARNAVLI